MLLQNLLNNPRTAYYVFLGKFFGLKKIATIDVTWRCQLHCTHCYFSDEGDKNERNLNEWNQFFNSLVHRGIKSVLLVGGEPTLRMDVIELATLKFKEVSLITNGQIKIPTNINCGIFLSIDGKQSTNDRIRGENTFRKAIENFKNDKRVIINITLNSENYMDLEDVIKISIDNGFIGVVCNIQMHKISPTDNSDIFTPEEREKIINHLILIKKSYPKQFLISKDVIKWYAKPDHSKHCFLKKHVLHFDYQFNQKLCFTNTPDCKHCGCYAGASFTTFLNV